MLYGRYKCLKSTFQFILTDIGCNKEAVSFFESQGFFLIADRTFSFHDENAYEGSLVDLAEHFFDVLSVENELIYDKGYVGEKLMQEMKEQTICLFALKRSNNKENWSKAFRAYAPVWLIKYWHTTSALH